MTRGRADFTVSMPQGPGAVTRLLLLRHGAAEGSGEGVFYGAVDAPLLAEGEAQAREAAARAAEWLTEAEAALFSSPLARSARTAEILAGAMGLDAKPRIIPEIAELRLGDWEGETRASLMEKHPARLRAHYENFVRSRPPGGGESLADLAARVLPALRLLRGRERGKNVIVCAHAAVNRVILCDALGAPLESFFRLEQDFAALNVIDYREGGDPLVRVLNA